MNINVDDVEHSGAEGGRQESNYTTASGTQHPLPRRGGVWERPDRDGGGGGGQLGPAAVLRGYS